MKRYSAIPQERIESEIASYYNPLLFLTPQRLRSSLDAFGRGELSPAARIFDMVYRRDDMTRIVSDKRHGDIAGLNWDIAPKGSDAAASERHKQVLKRFYDSLEFSHATDNDKRGCVSMLIDHMMSAVDNKYSVHEIIWKTRAGGELTAELRFVPLWFFEAKSGRLRFLRNTGDTSGVDMGKWEWLVCVSKAALMEPSSILYLAKNGGWKNWLVFADRFGFPLMDASTDAPSGSKEFNEFAAALRHFRNGYAIVHDKTSTVELREAGGAGAPFGDIVARADRAIAALWRGSDLSTLSGTNANGASVQDTEKASLENTDAGMIEESLEHNLSLRVLQYYFGEDVVPAAKFVLQRTDNTNARDFLDITERLARLGIRLGKRSVQEACRMPDPSPEEELVDIPSAPALPGAENEEADGASIEAILKKLADAKGKDVQPLLDEFSALEKFTDAAEFADALAALEKKIFELDIDGKHEAAALLEFLKGKLK